MKQSIKPVVALAIVILMNLGAVARAAEPEKQSAAAPSTPTEKPAATAADADLADATTPIGYRDTMNEEDLGAARPGNASVDPSYKGFMPIYGTKTWIKLGGYAKLDAIFDSTKVGNPNQFITGQIPVEGQPNFGTDEQFAMHAKQTRISFELRSPTEIGSLKIYYENDFFNNSDQPSMDYRLRHFYGQVANVLVGQTWSTFYDVDSFPDTLDFAGPGSLSVLRQPQVRYTFPPIGKAMHFAVAAEQSKNDMTFANTDQTGRNTMPDLTSHFRWEGKSAHLQVSGVLRDLAFNNATGPTETQFGWGGQVAGGFKPWGNDMVLANAIYGEGIGRYIQDLPSGSAGVVNAGGNLQLLKAWGAMASYQHHWNDKWRSTASYSVVQLDNVADQGAFAYERTHYVQANLIWAVTKNFYVGVEYLYGLKTTRNGNSGDDSRLQFSLKYNLMR